MRLVSKPNTTAINKNSKQIRISKKYGNVTTTIADLPDEILRNIFLKLPRDDTLFNVRFVCQKWNQLATDRLALLFWIL